MSPFVVLAALLTATALFSYVNHRFIGLPITIGVMLISLAASVALVIATPWWPGGRELVQELLAQVDFDEALLQGMLSFLLFAGALHIELDALLERKWPILSLASVGLVISTVLVGTAAWWITGLLGIDLPFVHALLFGALISPTDPIAVLAILKTTRAPRRLETKIAGESLFNDGFAVVVFLVLLEIATGEHAASAGHVARLFLQEAVGGALFGLAIGWVTYLMLKSVDNYQVELLLTLALVTGGYAGATALHLSGPIAIVVAGLLIGNRGRVFAMSETTKHNLDVFWELVDEVLNAVLFVLIGMEVLVLALDRRYFLAGLAMIPAALLARFVSVGIPVTLLRPFQEIGTGAVRVLTWGGLRGGISVALALSLPSGSERDAIVAITYAVVVFSIAVQGLTIGRVVARVVPPERPA